MPITDQKELNATKAAVKKSWDEESMLMLSIAGNIAETVQRMELEGFEKVEAIRDARLPLEIELWGKRREEVMRDTGVDPLTGKTMAEIMMNALGIKSPPKTPPAEKPFNTPFGDPAVDFDKLGL
jgi:hypothetical protein